MNNDEFFKLSTAEELQAAILMGQRARHDGLSRQEVNDQQRKLRRDQRVRYSYGWLTVWRNE